MQITAEDVKKLRDLTGAQMMKCKEALVQTGGDLEKAIQYIRERDKDAGRKLAERATGEGRVGTYIDPARGVGAIIEVLCESAPVAKNDMFVQLANDLARQVAEKQATSAEALLAQPYFADPKKTVADRISEVVGLMRENIKPARMARLSGVLGSYVHHDGTVGVLLQCEGASGQEAVLKDVCMHIAAANPVFVHRSAVPAEVLATEKEIVQARIASDEENQGKPANILEKKAEGMLRKSFYEAKVLADQPFVKDEKKTVGALLQGAGLTLVGFVRYRVGATA